MKINITQLEHLTHMYYNHTDPPTCHSKCAPKMWFYENKTFSKYKGKKWFIIKTRKSYLHTYLQSATTAHIALAI